MIYLSTCRHMDIKNIKEKESGEGRKLDDS